MIEQLQAELDQKRQEVSEAQRVVADLKEELSILEQKQMQLTKDKENLIIAKRDYTFQMGQL